MTAVASKPENDQLIIRYLLGEVSEAEEIQLEEEYFGDDDFFEQMLAVEDELIHAYMQGELSPHDRERFEKQFLSSAQQFQRVEFAKALVSSVSQAPMAVGPAPARQERMPWWQSWLTRWRAPYPVMPILLAGGLLALVLSGSWLIVESLQLRQQLEQAETERGALRQKEQELQRQVEDLRAHGDKLSEELQQERSQRNLLEQTVAKLKELQPAVASFVLTTGLFRGLDESETKVIPPDATLVRLYLALEEDDYKSYRAVLRTTEGKEIWRQSALKALRVGTSKTVVLSFPASRLNQGDYLVKLSGVTAQDKMEDVSEYYFRVAKR